MFSNSENKKYYFESIFYYLHVSKNDFLESLLCKDMKYFEAQIVFHNILCSLTYEWSISACYKTYQLKTSHWKS